MTIFDGSTVSLEDEGRLRTQLYHVYEVMYDGGWRTLASLQAEIQVKHPDANHMLPAISARLRDFRKSKFGSHTVNRNNLGSGLWEYQLIVNKGK